MQNEYVGNLVEKLCGEKLFTAFQWASTVAGSKRCGGGKKDEPVIQPIHI
ncbi:hypothetical protein [Paenibacillus glacialis]|nr:hypothetical protein [Paenibacillus glacialis]